MQCAYYARVPAVRRLVRRTNESFSFAFLRRLAMSAEESTLVAALSSRLDHLEQRVKSLERRSPVRFRVAQYNILSSYLGNNREPWFLFGALTRSPSDQERASKISERHQARDSTGHPLYPGWPRYVEGILSEAEIRAVEQRDAEVFAWSVRAPKILKTIFSLDADLVSLVELDRYESFFRHAFETAGYKSVWMKRPRETSADGCAILYRDSKMEMIDSSGFAYHDDVEGNRDRVALMGLFRIRHDCYGEDDRIIFVSTHLARNPENEKQNHIRIRQVSELMLELQKFCTKNNALHVPVVVAVLHKLQYLVIYFCKERGKNSAWSSPDHVANPHKDVERG